MTRLDDIEARHGSVGRSDVEWLITVARAAERYIRAYRGSDTGYSFDEEATAFAELAAALEGKPR